jgi:TonB-linked SusC/RagA family outer membrane protein
MAIKIQKHRIRILFLFSLLLASIEVSYSQIQIMGNVISSDDKMPLPGVNVVVQGAKGVGTISDMDGNFSLSVNQGTTLLVTYIGYKEQLVVVQNSAPLKIVLELNAELLNEVVAIGYGTMKKSDVTGAVASVKSEQLQKTPASGLDQALQGRAAGVTVNASSGQPGATAVVRIRGIGTINDSSPIYVVDGMILNDISFLSPNDIESTEVLKDASSTAIYGSMGANGVIIVTTKKGKDGAGKISFNCYTGVQNRWNKLDLMKRDEFTQTIVDLANVTSEKNYYKNNGFNKWLSAYRLGNSPYYPVILSTTASDGFDYSSVETDWQDEVFNKNAVIQNYHLSINGGNEKNKYAISASYFNQEGTIMGSNYERFTLRVNTSQQVRKWFTIGENLSFMSSTGRNAMNNNSSPGASILSAALAMAPWDPTHYAEGSYNNEGEDLSGQISASSNFKNVINPFSMVENYIPKSVDERWVGDIFVELKPIKNLTLRSDVSLDLNNNRDKSFKYAYEYSSYDQSTSNYLSSSMARYCTIQLENTINYTKDFGKHSFSALAGQTLREYNYYNIGGSGTDILNDSETNWYLSQTTDNETLSDDVDRTRMFSLLGRLHYSYNSKYMMTLNFRADSSSKFPENPWGYFPSTAVAWRISEEPWMKDIKRLDYLKLRFGWGQIGNEKCIGSDSFTLTMYNTGPTFVDYVLGETQSLASGAAVITYKDNGGKWEISEQLNLGVDFGFFHGLLNGNIDVYRRDTKDMLLTVKAPAQVGNLYDSYSNVGTVRNDGIEITLDHQSSVGQVKYSLGGNVSFVKNELTGLNGGDIIYGDKTIIDEGYSLYTYWGYKYEGIYDTDAEALEYLNGYTSSTIAYGAGDAKFTDLNSDGLIDDNDKTDLGNPFPWLTYGFNLGVDYRGFDLQVFCQGVYGNEIYNALRERTEGDGTECTLSTTMRNVWSSSNLDGNIPDPYGSSLNMSTSSRFVESGAYLRLKNVQIGYSLPARLIETANISRCRIYLTASNLLTFTGYTGYDPEVGENVDYGNYPQSRTVSLGFNLDF